MVRNASLAFLPGEDDPPPPGDDEPAPPTPRCGDFGLRTVLPAVNGSPDTKMGAPIRRPTPSILQKSVSVRMPA